MHPTRYRRYEGFRTATTTPVYSAMTQRKCRQVHSPAIRTCPRLHLEAYRFSLNDVRSKAIDRRITNLHRCPEESHRHSIRVLAFRLHRSHHEYHRKLRAHPCYSPRHDLRASKPYLNPSLQHSLDRVKRTRRRNTPHTSTPTSVGNRTDQGSQNCVAPRKRLRHVLFDTKSRGHDDIGKVHA